MTEQTRARTYDALTPSPGGGIGTAWPDEEPAGMVQVGTGLYTERLPVAGMTIEDIRETFADRLDIDPGAQPVVDGQLVPDESTRIQQGQQLAFVRHAGEKGAGGTVEFVRLRRTNSTVVGRRSTAGVASRRQPFHPER